MKKGFIFLLPLLYLLTSGPVKAQTKSCCDLNATGEFAMLGGNAKFQAAHLSPEPINFSPSKGVMVTFPVTGGKEGNAFFVRAAANSDKFLFIFHEWWGLNDHIKQEAERYAGDFPGVNILAIDLYDGELATNAEDAGKIMQSIIKERAEAIIKGALNYVGPTAGIQTLGWCFGGGWSMQAALLLGKQAKGCVIYYGMPEKDVKRLSTLNAPVLGIFASRDGWITKPIVEEFENHMKELKKPVSINWFDADHAFANPSNPKFDEAAASKARSFAVEFLRGNFGK
jgi:carboxymethylenebutenolidase